MFEHMSIAQVRVNVSFKILTVNGSPKRKEQEKKSVKFNLQKNIYYKCPNDDVSYIRWNLPLNRVPFELAVLKHTAVTLFKVVGQ
jgi:hypothetical protein